MVKYTESKTLPGVFIFEPEVFEDHRGEYVKIYDEAEFKKDIGVRFVEADISTSTKGVIKGVHGKHGQPGKLITCLYGKFYLIVVSNVSHAENYQEWESFVLSDKNRKMVYVPPGYGNGHQCLSDYCIFHYYQTEYYVDSSNQFTIKWNDPEFNFFWPIKNPILSIRDGGE